MYLLAVGLYRIGDYSKSRQLADRCLEVWLQDHLASRMLYMIYDFLISYQYLYSQNGMLPGYDAISVPLLCNQTLCSFLLVNCNWPNMYVCAEPMWHWQPIFVLNWYCNWIFLCHTTSWWLNFTKFIWSIFQLNCFFSSEVSVYIILKQALFFLLLVAGYLPSYWACLVGWLTLARL